MAQYLTINSVFKPYTFDELLKPVQLYGEEYTRQESALGELQTKADAWRNIADETKDPKAYKMYSDYMQSIEQATEALLQGLSPATRKSVIDMNKRYSSEIVPIEIAYKRRQELIDEQRKLKAQDNTMLFDVDADLLSLDTLIDNPQQSYTPLSMKDSYNNLASEAKAMQSAIRNNPEKWRSILGNQYYERVSQYGFTEQEIYNAIMGDTDANPLLTDLLNRHMSKFSILDQNKQALAYQTVAPALYNAIGEIKSERLANQGWEKPGNRTLPPTENKIKRSSLFTTEEQTQLDAEYKRVTEALQKYYTYDRQGKVILTEKGIKNLEKDTADEGSIFNFGNIFSSELKSLLQKLGIENATPAQQRQALEQYQAQLQQGDLGDITKVNSFVYDIKPSEKEAVLSILARSAPTTKKDEIQYDVVKFGKNKEGNKEYIKTNEKLSYDNLSESDISSVQMSEYGLVANLITKNGHRKTIVIPESTISEVDATQRTQFINLAYQAQVEIDNEQHRLNNNLENLTYGQIREIQQKIAAYEWKRDQYISDAYGELAQLFGTSLTEPQKIAQTNY